MIYPWQQLLAERKKTSTNKHGGKILANREGGKKKRWSKFIAAAAHFLEDPI